MADFNIEEILSKITENPEIMNKVSEIARTNKDGNITDALPRVMEAIIPSLNPTENSNEEEINTDEKQQNITSVDGAMKVPIEKLCQKINKNSKLLIALKPYLSKERCDIVDSIVKMAQVANLLSLTK